MVIYLLTIFLLPGATNRLNRKEMRIRLLKLQIKRVRDLYIFVSGVGVVVTKLRPLRRVLVWSQDFV